MSLLKKRPALSPEMRKHWLLQEEDAVWEEWVDHGWDPKAGTLLGDTTRKETFRARALIVLLWPGHKNCPVYWKDRGFSTNIEEKRIRGIPYDFDLSKLSPGLLSLAVELLEVANTIVRSWPAKDQPGVINMINSHIPRLLPIVSAEERERLFAIFDITAREYDIWEWFMRNPAISMEFKLRANKKMQDRIEQEQSGEVEPITERDIALLQYAWKVDSIVGSLRRESIGYTTALLANQIAFLVHNWNIPERASLLYESLPFLFSLFAKEGLREVNLALAEFVMSQEDDPFEIGYSSDRLLAASKMQDIMLAAGDTHRVARLLGKIEEATPRILEKEREESSVKDRTKVAYDALKAT